MLVVLDDDKNSRLRNAGDADIHAYGGTRVKIVTPVKNRSTGWTATVFLPQNSNPPGERSANPWCQAETVMGGGVKKQHPAG